MRMLTMKKMLEEIIAHFKLIYGFAPDIKDIVPLESYSYEKNGIEYHEYLAFAVNDIGYVYIPEVEELYKNHDYDVIDEWLIHETRKEW